MEDPTASPTPVVRKIGKFSNEELTFIKENLDKDPQWIADQLTRNLDTVKHYITKAHLSLFQEETDDESSIIARLVGRKDWSSIKKQFDADEIEIFKELWVRMYKQFGSDVLSTEELQIISVIQLELLKARNLEERNKALRQIAELELQSPALQKELDDARLAGDPGLISSAINAIRMNEEMIALQRASSQSRTNEYDKFLDKGRGIYKDLNSTRDQRVEKLRDNKATYIDWLLQVFQKDKFEQEAKELALRKEALRKEKERLTEYHTYQDGKLDQPLLTPETVKDD